jgi:2',3'-cyclic-nucleotide 2'-phosphodiesterase (5'-nucleotidase family)
MNRLLYLVLGLSLFASSCTYNHFVKSSGQFYASEKLTESDLKIDSIIAPYKSQVDAEMSKVIGQCDALMNKEQPESALGNWSADAVAERTAFYTKKEVDFAVLNYGGLRIGAIAAGNITKGKIFELMPFDNMLVSVEMKGSELDALFKYLVSKGGWPLSKGMRLVAGKDATIKSVSINGQNIVPDKLYQVATIDYLANGGDNCDFFVGKPQNATGVLLRNAVIEYVENQTKNGKTISAAKEGRLIIE